MDYGRYRFLLIYWLFVAVMLVLLLLFSCSPRVVSVPEYHSEYVVRTDTFLRLDSVYVGEKEVLKTVGESVFVDRYHTVYRDRWRERVLRDTLLRHDSIRVAVEVPGKVGLRAKARYGIAGVLAGMLFSLLGIIALCLIVRRFYRS